MLLVRFSIKKGCSILRHWLNCCHRNWKGCERWSLIWTPSRRKHLAQTEVRQWLLNRLLLKRKICINLFLIQPWKHSLSTRRFLCEDAKNQIQMVPQTGNKEHWPPSNVLQHPSRADSALYSNRLLDVAAIYFGYVWRRSLCLVALNSLNGSLLSCHRIWGSMVSSRNRALGHAIRRGKIILFVSLLDSSCIISLVYGELRWKPSDKPLEILCGLLFLRVSHWGMLFCCLKISRSYFNT